MKGQDNLSTEAKVFSVRLRALMDENKVTQAALAEYVKVQRQTISLYTTGQSKPDTEQLGKIALYFDVSTDWLLGLSEFRKIETKAITASELGLSESAIEVLKIHRDYFSSSYLIPTLNVLLEQEFPPPEMIDGNKSWLNTMDEAYKKDYEDACGDYWERRRRHWESKKYSPVLTAIDAYLCASVRPEIEYDLTNAGDIESERLEQKKPQLNSISRIRAVDVVDKVLLSAVEQCLKDLKLTRKEVSTNADEA